MVDESQPGEPGMPRGSKAVGVPVSSWINVVLSFLFAFFGVHFVLWIAFFTLGKDWFADESLVTAYWTMVAIAAAIGLFNACFFYTRAKAKLSRAKQANSLTSGAATCGPLPVT